MEPRGICRHATGRMTAANCTCSIWEGFVGTMRNIAQWKRWFADNADLIAPVRTAADIRRAKAEGKTGIILGFQNTSALEDQIGQAHPATSRASCAACSSEIGRLFHPC